MFFLIIFFGVSDLNTVARKYKHNLDYSNQNTQFIKFIPILNLEKLKSFGKAFKHGLCTQRCFETEAFLHTM